MIWSEIDQFDEEERKNLPKDPLSEAKSELQSLVQGIVLMQRENEKILKLTKALKHKLSFNMTAEGIFK